MKTLICCIGKNENRYIKEYINYYKNLGVSNICLYDNNDIGGERFQDVIQEDIDDGYVIYKNVRGLKKLQCQIYSQCYEEYGDLYDWILFIDCGDEYLQLNKHSTIDEFLSANHFAYFDVIHLSIMNFGDSDKVYYEDIPLNERFTVPFDFDIPYGDCMFINDGIPLDYCVSSIVKGHLNTVLTFYNPHTPANEELNTCDQYGIQCVAGSPFLPYNFSIAYFKHYTTKTIDEYCDKIKRGYPDRELDETLAVNLINSFFSVNKATDEKIKIVNDKLKDINIQIM